jgi:hypothetical protein
MFRFVIRDLLWLTVAVAIGAAWWLDHRQKALLEQNSRDLASLKAVLRGAGTDQEVAALLRALKNGRTMLPQAFISVPVLGQTPGVRIKPMLDPRSAPRYPHFAQPLTPTWPPR